ncbi:MAG: hypothetical protein DI601_00245 [Azospirillum brasilense]|nr:MAG: hypothetical protein DI601_00245 [Azospirillum brasilense]
MAAPRRITVSATTLFEVAARELGDARAWHRLATLNGLTDPEIREVRELLIPDRDPSLTGDGLPTNG